MYVARHGQSELNQQRRVSGQLNPDLSTKGISQSHRLAQVLRDEPLAAIYTSTLKRSIDTAAPIAQEHGILVQQHEALREIHHGIVQGQFYDERDSEAQRHWEEREKDKRNYRIPGGETFYELARRVIPCLMEILHHCERRTLLIVGHRSTNRVLLGKLMRWPEKSWCDLSLRKKYLYKIQMDYCPHLATISLGERETGRRYEGFKT